MREVESVRMRMVAVPIAEMAMKPETTSRGTTTVQRPHPTSTENQKKDGSKMFVSTTKIVYLDKRCDDWRSSDMGTVRVQRR